MDDNDFKKLEAANDFDKFEREIEECDPIAPARGIFNGIILGIIAWLSVVFIYKLCVLVYYLGVNAYWESFL